MLVLTRKVGEKLFIDSDITITVLEVAGHRVRIGVEAPLEVGILRGELRATPETVTIGPGNTQTYRPRQPR